LYAEQQDCATSSLHARALAAQLLHAQDGAAVGHVVENAEPTAAAGNLHEADHATAVGPLDARARAAQLLLLQAEQSTAAHDSPDAVSCARHEVAISSMHTSSQPGWQDPNWQGLGPEEQAGEAAVGEDDFADDVGCGSVCFPFEQSDMGQDYDHLLGNDERNWEHTRVGEALPPGWAKCPNMGNEIFCMTPVKVPYPPQNGARIAYATKPHQVALCL
jgi:hypothetical protein